MSRTSDKKQEISTGFTIKEFIHIQQEQQRSREKQYFTMWTMTLTKLVIYKQKNANSLHVELFVDDSGGGDEEGSDEKKTC